MPWPGPSASQSGGDGETQLLIEHAHRDRRGRAISVNAAASNLAAGEAAGVALLLANLLTPEQLSASGWRAVFPIVAPAGLIGLWLRIRLRDTPAFEALGEAPRPGRAPVVQALGIAKRGMLVFTAWISAVTVGNYLLPVFLPAYLIRVVGGPDIRAHARYRPQPANLRRQRTRREPVRRWEVRQ
jgi:MHS family proline/betaine transporter-like MFS transporter